MKKSIITVLLFAIIPLLLNSEADSELARLYLDEAFFNFHQENIQLAQKNLSKSISFSDQLSESWYLSGMMSEYEGNRLRALEQYEKSINMGDFYREYFSDLLLRYITLLNITGHHKMILDFYKTHLTLINSYNTVYLLISDSAYKYGLIHDSFKMAQDVYKNNPHSLKALIYMMRSSESEQLFPYFEKNINNFQKDDLDEILFQELILLKSPKYKAELIKIYKNLFGMTPFYYTLENVQNPSIEQSRNLLIRSSGRDVLEDGVYFGDYNFDGISDEIISVTGNDMTYLKDENQDNITDISINFSKSTPVNIFINNNGISYQFKYSEYPFVEEIQYNNQSLKRVYKIYPGIKYTPLDDSSDFSWKYDINRRGVLDDFLITPIKLLQLSYEFDEYPASGEKLFRTYHVKDGEIYHIREDSRLSGNYDHFMNISAWNLETGSQDINNDGKIDIYEYYENGKLSGIAVDLNNNGKSEYLEDWSLLDIKSWDFNEDSYIDTDFISSFNTDTDYQVPVKNGDINKYDIYSWDFSLENFWFINN